MTLQEQRDIIQAAIDGKKLEIRLRYPTQSDMPNNWLPRPVGSPFSSFSFDFSRFEYRIKPELREFWVNLYPLDDLSELERGVIHPSKESANLQAAPDRLECIRVREVKEDEK